MYAALTISLWHYLYGWHREQEPPLTNSCTLVRLKSIVAVATYYSSIHTQGNGQYLGHVLCMYTSGVFLDNPLIDICTGLDLGKSSICDIFFSKGPTH